jgi:hypothetical protein
LQKNPVFKAKPSRRPQSLCVKLTKLPPYDEITRFDGMVVRNIGQSGTIRGLCKKKEEKAMKEKERGESRKENGI